MPCQRWALFRKLKLLKNSCPSSRHTKKKKKKKKHAFDFLIFTEDLKLLDKFYCKHYRILWEWMGWQGMVRKKFYDERCVKIYRASMAGGGVKLIFGF